jgi:aspartate racemase
MADRFEAKLLGVLGGMGPMAGAVFMERLTAMTKVQYDQQHIPAVLWSDPRVPDPREELVVVWMANSPGTIRWKYREMINALVYQAIVD